MSAYLLHADGALLHTGGPLLKAAEAVALSDAIAVLGAAQVQAEMLGKAAEEAGFAAGEAAGRAEFAQAIAALVAAGAEHREARETEIARLALAALRHIAGSLADGDVTAAIASRAAQTVVGQGAVTITVAPDMVAAVETALGPIEATVSADPALRPAQCRVTTPEGHVIADLDTQIAAIAERWGAGDGD